MVHVLGRLVQRVPRQLENSLDRQYRVIEAVLLARLRDKSNSRISLLLRRTIDASGLIDVEHMDLEEHFLLRGVPIQTAV